MVRESPFIARSSPITPSPVMLKSAVCGDVVFWMKLPVLNGTAPAYCQLAPPLVLLQTRVADDPAVRVEPSRVKLVVPTLDTYSSLP